MSSTPRHMRALTWWCSSCQLKPRKILLLKRAALKVLIRITWRISFSKTGQSWKNMKILGLFTIETLKALLSWTGINKLVPTGGIATKYNQQDTNCILPKIFILHSYSISVIIFYALEFDTGEARSSNLTT